MSQDTHHGGTETRRELVLEELTNKIIGAAIEVHKELGPGLMESAYEECLCHELRLRGIGFERQVPLPVEYKGLKLDCGYRLDVVVEDAVVLELKCVERVLPVHCRATDDLSQDDRQEGGTNHQLQS